MRPENEVAAMLKELKIGTAMELVAALKKPIKEA